MKMEQQLEKLKNIKIEEFTYNLPDERIAKYPLPHREDSKLLVYREGDIEEHRFSEVRRLLTAGQSLIFNNTNFGHLLIKILMKINQNTNISCQKCQEPQMKFCKQGLHISKN